MQQKQFTIQLGAFADTIGKQLKKQGFKFDSKKMKYFEQLSEHITFLKFGDILNDKQVDAARGKLFTQIKKHLSKNN